MSPKNKEQFELMRESSRENIISAAKNLFASNGFFNTSIRQIASSANISTGLLYNYFKSKEELLTEIVNNAFGVMYVENEQSKTIDPSKSILKTIESFFILMKQQSQLIKMLAHMAIQANKFDFVNQLLMKKYNAELANLAKHFQELEFPEPEAEARLLMATLDGILFQVMVLNIKDLPLVEIEKMLIDKYTKL